MAGQTQNKIGYTKSFFSTLKLIYTIAVESTKNMNKPTYIGYENGSNGDRVISVRVGK